MVSVHSTCSVNIKKTPYRFRLIFNHFCILHLIIWPENSWDLCQVKFISIVTQFCEEAKPFMVILSSYSKVYFSVEYKTVHGLNQAVFRT